MSNITSIRELKREATERGSYFFTSNTMKMFNSRIIPRSIVNVPDSTRGYFVTYDRPEGLTGGYTVHVFDTAEERLGVTSVSDFREYDTEEAAINAARFIAGVSQR